MLLGGVKFFSSAAQTGPAACQQGLLHSVAMLWDFPPVPTSLVSLLCALEHSIGICKISLVSVAICIVSIQCPVLEHTAQKNDERESTRSSLGLSAKTNPDFHAR